MPSRVKSQSSPWLARAKGQRQREEPAMSNCKRFLTTWLEANASYCQSEFLVELAEAGTSKCNPGAPASESQGELLKCRSGPSRPEVGACTRSRVLRGFQCLLMSEATALQGFQTVLRKPENLLRCRRDLRLVSGQSSQVHVIQSP